MEVQEKRHVPAPTPSARPAAAPGHSASSDATSVEPPAGLRRPLEKPVAAASPAQALAPRPLPDRLLGWVDVHRWKLLAGLVLLYVIGFNGQWRMEPDSALYLTIGRNLAEGRGYSYHGVHHHLAYPGLPWLFAATFKIFGTATEYVRVGDQGARFIFRFCPVCGTTVFHSEEGHDDSVGVAVGAFADPAFPAPQVSVYDCRRHSWVQLPPGTQVFEKDPP